MIERAISTRNCPQCKQARLVAVEVMRGHVSSYRCQCGAYYDAVPMHDFDRNEHWWVGKLRNPEFWNLRNQTIEDGLSQMAARLRANIPEYTGYFAMERIPVERTAAAA